jgi:hypothetical protein
LSHRPTLRSIQCAAQRTRIGSQDTRRSNSHSSRRSNSGLPKSVTASFPTAPVTPKANGSATSTPRSPLLHTTGRRERTHEAWSTCVFNGVQRSKWSFWSLCGAQFGEEFGEECVRPNGCKSVFGPNFGELLDPISVRNSTPLYKHSGGYRMPIWPNRF